MSQLTLRDIDESLMRKLQQRADAHGQPAEEEAKAILAEVLAKAEPDPDPWAAVDAVRERLIDSGRTFSDSAELIREDRDR